KGLKENIVIIKHGLRNALIPIITILGLRFGMLLGGAVLTETVFSWPGVGRLMVDSILSRDYPVVQGSVLVLALMFVLINLLVDVLYAFLDPQIHYN
ncbi:MAG: ABC transporter permease, partial [Halanaerobium sp.]